MASESKMKEISAQWMAPDVHMLVACSTMLSMYGCVKQKKRKK